MKLLEGIVEGYGKDAWKGTLTVRLLGVKKEEGCIEHVRVVTSYANQKGGIFVFPEIGDIVLISFLDQGSTQAICMGTLLPLNASILEETKEDNAIKLIKMLSGFTIFIDETKDKERLCIKSNSELQLVLDEESQSISIGQADEKQYLRVDMKENKVSLHGGDSMSLLCGDAKIVMEKGNLILEGKDIKINCTKLNVDASSDFDVNGVNVTLNASNKMLVHSVVGEVSADMKLDIKGSMINIV